MRKAMFIAIFATACATPGSNTRPSPSAGRASTESVEYLIRGRLLKDPQLAEHERAHVRFCQLANTVF